MSICDVIHENLFPSFTHHLKDLEKQILLSQTCHTQQSACQGKPEQWSLLMTLNRVLLQFKLSARWNFLLRTSGYPELREIHAKILGTTRYIISHDECHKGRHENTFCAWTRNKLVNPPALTFFGQCLCVLSEYWRWLQGCDYLEQADDRLCTTRWEAGAKMTNNHRIGD